MNLAILHNNWPLIQYLKNNYKNSDEYLYFNVLKNYKINSILFLID